MSWRRRCHLQSEISSSETLSDSTAASFRARAEPSIFFREKYVAVRLHDNLREIHAPLSHQFHMKVSHTRT